MKVGYLLCMLSLCVSVVSYAQNTPMISGYGTATIDGIKQAGEWARAGRLVFEARMDGQRAGRKSFAILYAMNDDTHLFLGLVTEPGLLDSRWLRLVLKNGSATAEFYINKQGEQLLQGVPGANPCLLLEVRRCRSAKFGNSQGYDMLEFEYFFVRGNLKPGLSLHPGQELNLQMSLLSCPELPSGDACWGSAGDAFITATGNSELVIQIVDSRNTAVKFHPNPPRDLH